MTLPADSRLRFLVQLTALHQHRLGKEIGKRAQVLPNGKYFPDRFTADAASALTLLRRMQQHAGMTDIPLEIAVLGGPTEIGGQGCGCHAGPETNQSAQKNHDCKGDCGGKGCEGCDGSCHHVKDDADEPSPQVRAATAPACSSGCGSGCALPPAQLDHEPRLVDLGNGWRVQVPAAELAHPVALTTNLARALGVIFLSETSSPGSKLEGPIELHAEIVGCLLGFGSLLLAGSYVYSKSCGGPRIGKVTNLGPDELGFVTVLFAKLQNHELRPLLRELDATQKDAVENAADWLEQRPALVERFIQSPAKLVNGDIPMAIVPTGFFSRLFGKSKSVRELAVDVDGDLAELEALLVDGPRPTESRSARRPDPKVDELRALVDEALQNPGEQTP